jgi:hypothetical protein
MSAFPSKADIIGRDRNVRFVPEADTQRQSAWLECRADSAL